MNVFKSVPLVIAMAIMSLAACGKPANKVEMKTLTTTTTPQGKVETKVESKQVGSTLVANTETKRKTEAGTVETNVETVVGTVTAYEPGRRIEVLTGEDSRHEFELDDKDMPVIIAGAVQIGTHVTLVKQKGDYGSRLNITVEDAP